MTARFASDRNTYVQSFDASGHLVVGFSRNPKAFPLNNYITITPVKKQLGLYLKLTAEQAARILNANLAEFSWPDGNDQPDGKWNTESFEFKPFVCSRYAYAFRLGYLTEQQADWNIKAQHAAIVAQQAMTARTLKVADLLNTSGTYDTGHTDTAVNWGGGKFDAGTSTAPYLRKGLLKMAEKINIATLGVVQPKDLCVVMNPTVARTVANSAELHDYIKSSPDAWPRLQGDREDPGHWGLPARLYGFKVVVEDTVQVSTIKGATKTSDYALADDLYMTSRPGELVGVDGAPSFGSVHLFMMEEMTVETKDDPDNRRVLGRVVENYDVKAVATAALCRATAPLT